MATFKTKDGKRISFKSSPKRKSSKKSAVSAAQRRRLSAAAKKRPRYKTGPKKGQFKPKR